MTNLPPTPLLADDSPLDARARGVVAALFEGERQLMAALPTDDPCDPARLRRVLLTHGEMLGQPDAIQQTLRAEADGIRDVARALAVGGIRRVYLTGCGDSLAVMIGARLLLETMFGVPCEPVQALELAYYQAGLLGADTLVVALSSSGSTTRTVEAVMVAQARGARTLALSNRPASALMRECTDGLCVHAERRGWPTQSSTAALALLCRLGIEVGLATGRPGAAALATALDAMPQTMRRVLAESEPVVRRLAEAQADRRIYLYAGGGPAYASALFGATKMKECSPEHAMALPLEEFHHYNSLKPGDPLFVLAPAGPSVARARDTAEEGRRWRGHVYAVVSEGETALDNCSEAVLRLPALPEALAALAFSPPVQLFAYHVALAKFRRAGALVPE